MLAPHHEDDMKPWNKSWDREKATTKPSTRHPRGSRVDPRLYLFDLKPVELHNLCVLSPSSFSKCAVTFGKWTSWIYAIPHWNRASSHKVWLYSWNETTRENPPDSLGPCSEAMGKRTQVVSPTRRRYRRGTCTPSATCCEEKRPKLAYKFWNEIFQPTNQPTNRPTNQPMSVFLSLVAFWFFPQQNHLFVTGQVPPPPHFFGQLCPVVSLPPRDLKSESSEMRQMVPGWATLASEKLRNFGFCQKWANEIRKSHPFLVERNLWNLGQLLIRVTCNTRTSLGVSKGEIPERKPHHLGGDLDGGNGR